jgi:GDPmannose 4,6-dehydratase
MKKIIITGVTGQDGSHMVDYLLQLLSENKFMIYGTARRLSVKNHDNILHLENEPRFKLLNMDLNDAHSIRDVIIDIQPDYFINFGAQSFVAGSWNYPIQTWNTDADAVLHILESIRRFAPLCRFYNAGSSEEFGDVISTPQSESHPLRPQSPYGAAKCAARHIVRVYRESYNLYAIQGWLFNHEGPRRGLDFVTRKISHGIARIKYCIEKNKSFEPIRLGNLDAKRDWSDAEDVIKSVWLMLNQDKPVEYVIGSGKMNSVRNFIETCLACANIDFTREGEFENEKYFYKKNPIIVIDSNFYRPAEVHKLCADYSLAKKNLNWKPSVTFDRLVEKMYHNDYELFKSKL